MVAPLATLRLGVLRPKDAAKLYAQPRAEFLRLEEAGVLLKIVHGYYALIPEARRGLGWRPEIEALALSLGQADYGREEVALMHISAARIHGAIPRALAVAVLAVPKQRPELETKFGRIVFVKRNVLELETIKTETELAIGWVTSIEQTALDLARRPNLVSGIAHVARESATALLVRSDEKKLGMIIQDQRMGAAYLRLTSWIKNA